MAVWEVITDCDGPVIEIDMNTYKSTGRPLQRSTKREALAQLQRQRGGQDAALRVRRICPGAYGVYVLDSVGEWAGEFTVRTIIDKGVEQNG